MCAVTNPAPGRAGPCGAHARGPGARGCGHGQARHGGRPQRAAGRPLHSGAQPWAAETGTLTLAAAIVLLCMASVWAAHVGLCNGVHQPWGIGPMMPVKPGRSMQGVVEHLQRPKCFTERLGYVTFCNCDCVCDACCDMQGKDGIDRNANLGEFPPGDPANTGP